MCKIAQTVAVVRPFSWEVHDPVARAGRDFEKPLITRLFESFQERLCDLAGPHDNAVVFAISTTTT